MTDQPAHEKLATQVQLTIDPIAASARRKQAMSEELLAHLLGAYEQELNATVSEYDALNAALARFGNIEILREELTQSVPLAERLFYHFSSPREQIMLRWILVGIAVIAIGMAIVLPALAKIKSGEIFTIQGAVMLSIGVALVVLGITTIGFKIARRASR
jgi:hypothetical protein